VVAPGVLRQRGYGPLILITSFSPSYPTVGLTPIPSILLTKHSFLPDKMLIIHGEMGCSPPPMAPPLHGRTIQVLYITIQVSMYYKECSILYGGAKFILL
jgi:hypothetical protein